MDQRFSARSDAIETSEKENRRLGAVFLLIGAVCTWAIWYLGPRWSQLSGARIVVLTLAGGALLVCGLATVIFPPAAEYKSPANKQRNAVLGMIGLALGAVELYFYNDIYGIW
jgi:hypothetical protein